MNTRAKWTGICLNNQGWGFYPHPKEEKNMIKYEKPIFEILIVTDIITTSGNEEYEGEIDWM